MMLARGNISIQKMPNTKLPIIYRIQEAHGRPNWLLIAFRVPFTKRSVTLMASLPTFKESS